MSTDEKENIARGPSDRIMVAYDGTSEVERWLSLVTRAKTLLKWEDKDVSMNASLYLVGDAKTWYETGRYWEHDQDFETFSKLLKQRFTRKSPKFIVMAKLQNLKYVRNEDVRAWAARLRSTAHESETQIHTDELCGLFLSKLPPHYHVLKVQAQQGQDMLDLLMEECRRVQVSDSSAMADPEPTQQRDKNHASSSGSHATSQRFNGNCNYCGIAGHRESECHKKMRDQDKPAETQQGVQTRDSNKTLRWDPKTQKKLPASDHQGPNTIVCHFCKKPGHKQDDCYLKKKLLAMLDEDDSGGGDVNKNSEF